MHLRAYVRACLCTHRYYYNAVLRSVRNMCGLYHCSSNWLYGPYDNMYIYIYICMYVCIYIYI